MNVLLGWRGGAASVVFVTGVLALSANDVLRSPLLIATPWLISLAGLAALMWAFGRRKGQ
jgi:hypothetical protein